MAPRIHFISAGAGSGKTHRLTGILHEQLMQGTVRPSGVMATTFSNKAAAELRERVRSHLLGQGAHALATAMGQARLGTVNSVCGSLLGRFAFEAGLSTTQRVLDEPQAEMLVGHAIDAVMDESRVAQLLEVAGRLGIEDWQGECEQLMDRVRANDIDARLLAGFARDNAADLLQHFPPSSRRDLTAALVAAIDMALPLFAAAQRSAPKPVKATATYVDEMRTLRRDLESGRTPWSAWLKLSKMQPEVKLAHLAEPVGDILQCFAEHPQLRADIEVYLEKIFALCADAMENYADRKRELGVLDFTDQEHLLLELLDHPDVAAVLSEELDLLMVDEFQDTSPIQLALFLKLASFAREVYWVGDIKQAIYGFRGSDTALMEAILDELGRSGGQKEILKHSWRSREPLVQIVNEAFCAAFAGTLQKNEIVLEACRTEQINGPAFANWMLGGKNKGDEAASLAAGIKGLVASGREVFDKTLKHVRPVRFSDIALLFKSNDDVKHAAAQLRANGVPGTTAQAGLLATPEAVLALACLRRMNDAEDTLATAEILSLVDCSDPEDWLADRLTHLANSEKPALWREEGVAAHPVLTVLAGMRKHLYLMTPAEALQAVVTRCDLVYSMLRWNDLPAIHRSGWPTSTRCCRWHELTSKRASVPVGQPRFQGLFCG